MLRNIMALVILTRDSTRPVNRTIHGFKVHVLMTRRTTMYGYSWAHCVIVKRRKSEKHRLILKEI